MSKKHGLIMIACCAIAIGAAMAIFVFKVPTNNVILPLLLLLCPLSHLLMMGTMGHGSHADHAPSTLAEKSHVDAHNELGKG